jgi:hypothetical protein
MEWWPCFHDDEEDIEDDDASLGPLLMDSELPGG